MDFTIPGGYGYGNMYGQNMGMYPNTYGQQGMYAPSMYNMTPQVGDNFVASNSSTQTYSSKTDNDSLSRNIGPMILGAAILTVGAFLLKGKFGKTVLKEGETIAKTVEKEGKGFWAKIKGFFGKGEKVVEKTNDPVIRISKKGNGLVSETEKTVKKEANSVVNETKTTVEEEVKLTNNIVDNTADPKQMKLLPESTVVKNNEVPADYKVVKELKEVNPSKMDLAKQKLEQASELPSSGITHITPYEKQTEKTTKNTGKTKNVGNKEKKTPTTNVKEKESQETLKYFASKDPTEVNKNLRGD